MPNLHLEYWLPGVLGAVLLIALAIGLASSPQIDVSPQECSIWRCQFEHVQ